MGSSPTPAPAGPITQALNNVEAGVQAVAAIGTLPPQAMPIRDGIVSLGRQVYSTVSYAQQSARQFAEVCTALAEQALNTIKFPIPNEPAGFLSSIVSEAQHFGPIIEQANQLVSSARSQVDQYAAELLGIAATVKGNLEAYEARRAADQAEVNALNQKKYYWLALGPLGVIGLGVAIGELVAANKKVAGLQGQMSGLTSQISQLSTMSTNVQQLRLDLPVLADKFQYLSNAITFVTGDFANVIKDSNLEASLFLHVLQGELSKILTDAS